MVSYDLMDAIKCPPDARVFQHYIDSAGEAVNAFADMVTQVSLVLLWPGPCYGSVRAPA